ncbi:uncharacterized protein K489DRAFT_326976, partial [Dissoconium aciculare CBS 342.82]|uniref:Uncharacterized protein n=1 Tax=Dissoconium aciculare CBS 342.82 TaxID=1314786 RepID=A0A6J3LU42_9PEZI
SINMASEYFEYEREWQLAVCRECRVAIWPAHAAAHLRGPVHRVPGAKAQQAADELQAWPGIVNHVSQFAIPIHVDRPVPALALYMDGIQCRLEPTTCRYINRSMRGIQEHWRTCHQWSVRSGRGGGSGAAKARDVEAAKARACAPLQCQRFFAQGPHSSYVEVRQPQQDPDPGAAPAASSSNSTEAAWLQIWKQASEAFDAGVAQAGRTITEGGMNEANPWLRRTGWAPYLAGQQRDELLQLVEAPAEQPDEQTSAGAASPEAAQRERIARAVWNAMAGVARASQATVTESGMMIRMQAVRTERDQVRHQPLQPYQERTSITKRCRPWQQMLMFFVRTQQARAAGEEAGPPYRFHQQQATAFSRMITAAEAAADAAADPADEPVSERVEV